MLKKLKIWWLFTMRNPVVRVGEEGGFKWEFRRFWLDIRTISGNFKARFIASEHPYGYLLAGKGDENIQGFCEMLYTIGSMLTTDQQFVNDINDAVNRYAVRISGQEVEREDDDIALEEVKAIQEHIELPEKERKKVEKDINKRFKKAVKNAVREKN